MNPKIGVAVITCNRQDFFRQCISSIPAADVLVVVNDGTPYDTNSYPSRVHHVIQHARNRGVGKSKNDAFRFLLGQGCEHIFLCEDDLAITSKTIFQSYIQASKRSGIGHFNFALHGPANKLPDGRPNPRFTHEYSLDVSLSFHQHIVGAFSYYNADVLRGVGLMDEVFKNACEHIDHTYRIIKAGRHPPFWWFADLAESGRFICDLDPDLSRSIIRKKHRSFRFNEVLFNLYFRLKHRSSIARIPDTPLTSVLEALRSIQRRYGRL